MRGMRPSALVVALALLWAPAPTLTAQGAARIVAIGDIHGEIAGFKSILKAAGLADDAGRWIGGRAQFVQTGDYTDRGEGTRAVMDLLMALEPQARKAGGRAHILLGNHEVMNLIGDTRDATPETFATFADASSEKRRNDAWEAYARLAAARTSKGEPVPAVYAQTREAWMTTHPPGYVEYRNAFAPRGRYGAWVRERPVVAAIGGSIFMHAGISPQLAPEKLEDVNVQVRDEIRRLDRFVDRLIDLKLATHTFTLQEMVAVAVNEITVANRLIAAAQAEGKEPDPSRLNVPLLLEAQEILKIDTWAVLNPEGPMWYRGLATEPDDPAGGPFLALLAKYGARRFVTGHTPQQSRDIAVRFGGRAILLDTGMLAAVYKGRPAALEIAGDTLTAIYEDGRQALPSLPPPAHPRTARRFRSPSRTRPTPRA